MNRVHFDLRRASRRVRYATGLRKRIFIRYLGATSAQWDRHVAKRCVR